MKNDKTPTKKSPAKHATPKSAGKKARLLTDGDDGLSAEGVKAQLHALMRMLGKEPSGISEDEHELRMLSGILVYPQIIMPSSGAEFLLTSGGAALITLQISTNDPATTHELAYRSVAADGTLGAEAVAGDVPFPYFWGHYWTPGVMSLALTEGNWILTARVKGGGGHPTHTIFVKVTNFGGP
jgi:hypothetical protein